MDVTIAVCTFGDDSWIGMARERAVPSAEQFGVPVLQIHAGTLDGARNLALHQCQTERMVFLDADDELEPGYLDIMGTATGDIRVPSVRYVSPGRWPRARMPRVVGHQHHDCTAECLEWGNWVVIGACAPAALLRQVGGWREFPVYEDYDLWVRCWQAGATFERVEAAVYRAHVRPDSRNRGPEQTFKHAVHQKIAEANGLPVPA